MHININSRHRAVGALGLAVLMVGCGTVKPSTHPSPSTHTTTSSPITKGRTITVNNLGMAVTITIPHTWPMTFDVMSSGLQIGNGMKEVEFFVAHKTYSPHLSSHHVTSGIYFGTYSLYKPMGKYHYVAVLIPNTATNRKIAHKIIASVKLR